MKERISYFLLFLSFLFFGIFVYRGNGIDAYLLEFPEDQELLENDGLGGWEHLRKKIPACHTAAGSRWTGSSLTGNMRNTDAPQHGDPPVRVGVSLEKEVFSITGAVREILGRYTKLTDYSITFHAEEEIFVCADKLKISQVIYNLVNNALTYTGEDKRVMLEQETDEGKVRISVTDTGEGIPQDKLLDIWERYYKVDKAHKRAQVGTGLGLSIVKTILDMHGVAYGVESQEGVGSTFWFELDITDPPSSS